MMILFVSKGTESEDVFFRFKRQCDLMWRAVGDKLSVTSYHGRAVLDELLGTSCPWRAFRDELFLTSYKGRAVLDELSGTSCPWRVIRNELSLTCYQGRAVLDELSGTSCPCRAIRDELSLTSYPCRVFNGKLYVTSCSSFCGLATAFKNWGIFGPYIYEMPNVFDSARFLLKTYTMHITFLFWTVFVFLLVEPPSGEIKLSSRSIHFVVLSLVDVSF